MTTREWCGSWIQAVAKVSIPLQYRIHGTVQTWFTVCLWQCSFTSLANMALNTARRILLHPSTVSTRYIDFHWSVLSCGLSEVAHKNEWWSRMWWAVSKATSKFPPANTIFTSLWYSVFDFFMKWLFNPTGFLPLHLLILTWINLQGKAHERCDSKLGVAVWLACFFFVISRLPSLSKWFLLQEYFLIKLRVLKVSSGYLGQHTSQSPFLVFRVT